MKYWTDLSLKEKIGQTVVLQANPENEVKKCGSLKAFLEKYPAGGLFMGGEVIKEADKGPENVLKAVVEYSKASELPLLFAADMENGCGSMVKGLTTYPHLMALGAARSEKLAFAYGRGTALEAASIGINWTFSPVADLNQNRFNPVTNIRSVSDDPGLAIPTLKAVIKGMQENGLASTAKHFPGDGTDYRDQHLVTTKNSLSLEEWKKNHGAVFQALIDNGVYAIMTGHISFPAWQKETIGGRYLPATLSYELTTKLLKEEMGFKGVVVSDALVMGGFLGWYERARAEVECFKAGTDMMLWPALGYFDAMEQAVLSGEVSMQRLDDAVSRIWSLKEKLDLFSEDSFRDRPLKKEDSVYVKKVAHDVAEKSITLLRDSEKMLPINAKYLRKLLLIATSNNSTFDEEISVFKNELELRGIEVVLKRNILIEELEEIQDQYDLIIYTLYSWPHRPLGPLDFFGEDGRNMWVALTSGVEKSIVISFGTPYLHNQYFEGANVYINTYSNSEESQKALAGCLFGEITFQGVSPVKI